MTDVCAETVRYTVASRHRWDALGSYDFSIFSRVVDVGGSLGWFVEALLQRYGHTQATLLQEPHLAEPARKVLANAGVLARCEVEETSVLHNVSAVGDAYVVPCLLGHCDDDQAALIFSNCRRAMTSITPLVVIDRVSPEHDQLDLRNQTVPPGTDLMCARPRTAASHQQLLARAGFALTRVVPTPGPLSIVEAYPYG